MAGSNTTRLHTAVASVGMWVCVDYDSRLLPSQVGGIVTLGKYVHTSTRPGNATNYESPAEPARHDRARISYTTRS